MKIKMKKIVSFLLVITTLITFNGCSKNKDEVVSNSSTIQQSATLSYKSADIKIAEEFSEILCTDSRGDDFLIFGKLKSGEYGGYITDTDFIKNSSFTFTPKNDESIKSAALMDSSKTAVLTTVGTDTLIYVYGTFVDLYSLIDNDDDISRDDFLDGYLELMETNGKLYQITASFIMNSLMIKDKYSNGLTSWNVNELEQIYMNRPENMELSVDVMLSTKEEMFSFLFKSYRYTDTAECNFDSPEFIKEMKFIKNNNIGISDDFISNSVVIDENDDISKFHNDEVLLQFAYLTGFDSLRKYVQVYGNEPITLIGFPNDMGINAGVTPGRTYGITANSQNIEGAWDFLKYYFFSEYAFENGDEHHAINSKNFCGLEKFYKKQLEDIATPHTYIDTETGEEINIDIYNVGVDGKNRYDLQPFTKEEVEKYDNFVRSAVKQRLNGDATVNGIVWEEVAAYFAGERSAEETAKIIQNRVAIYLSEKS